MKTIYLTNKTDKKSRREIHIDDFSYTISTSSGESVIVFPGGRSYDTDDYMNVYANGAKLQSGVQYTRSSSTTITVIDGETFPGGLFPDNCRLDFELFTTNG